MGLPGLAAPALAAAMATIGTAVPALGAGGLATVAALTGTTMGSVAVAASFGGKGGVQHVHDVDT